MEGTTTPAENGPLSVRADIGGRAGPPNALERMAARRLADLSEETPLLPVVSRRRVPSNSRWRPTLRWPRARPRTRPYARRSLHAQIKAWDERTGGFPVIAEVKPASPSRGPIRPELAASGAAAELAVEYERAGACGVSVLTEPRYFRGSYENLLAVAHATRLPLLMKDFLVHESQVDAARVLGASNLLVVVGVTPLRRFAKLLRAADVEPLFEVHDLDQVKALAAFAKEGFPVKLVGVNNRDLRTMKVDLSISEELIPVVREVFGREVAVVSESGVLSRDDVEFVRSCGADAALVGSCLVESPSPGEKLKELVRSQGPAPPSGRGMAAGGEFPVR
ncbi:MAG: hypothetical protein Kow0069_24110 [Promethearchaeota archaeon]